MNLHPDCKSATRARTNCNIAHDMLCAGAVVNVLVYGHCAGAGASANVWLQVCALANAHVRLQVSDEACSVHTAGSLRKERAIDARSTHFFKAHAFFGTSEPRLTRFPRLAVK
eukprot:15479742-Alexandrium_andersonii.AAC.1